MLKQHVQNESSRYKSQLRRHKAHQQRKAKTKKSGKGICKRKKREKEETRSTFSKRCLHSWPCKKQQKIACTLSDAFFP